MIENVEQKCENCQFNVIQLAIRAVAVAERVTTDRFRLEILAMVSYSNLVRIGKKLTTWRQEWVDDQELDAFFLPLVKVNQEV